MAEYENPIIPEGINVVDEHPLKEFFVLVLGALGLVFVLVVVLSLASGFLAPLIPIQWEYKISSYIEESLEGDEQGEKLSENKQADDVDLIQEYLQKRIAEIAELQSLSDDYILTVHYVDDGTINAMAALGGHIIVFRGLLENTPDENSLMMVLAHEVSHIKNRDPIVAFVRGITVSLALSLISGAVDSSSDVLGEAGFLTMLSFDREQERQADADALKTLVRYYGHAKGAAGFFKEMENHEEGKGLQIEMLQSHPLTKERVELLSQDDNNSAYSVTQLPDYIRQLRLIAKDD